MLKVISGGQTGADRAGLDAAWELGLETGGTAPNGYRTDAGSDLTLKALGLIEHPSPGYRARTIQNVHDSDGTAWFGNPQSPGGRLTLRTVMDIGKPFIINPTAAELRLWLVQEGIEILNVAGNRERTNPGIYERVKQIVKEALSHAETPQG